MNNALHLIMFLFQVFSFISFGQSTEKDKIETIFVKGGWFEMGGLIVFDKKAEETFPVHKVYLSNFHIGRYEVTNQQYCEFLNSMNFILEEIKDRIYVDSRFCKIKYKEGKCIVIKGYEQYPVISVTWEAATEFCKAKGGRLPTEAEWEYAARGGQKSQGFDYSGSNNADEVAVTGANFGALQKVGSLKPNELGIYDMSGNISEFCSDWYDEDYYKHSPTENPTGPVQAVKHDNGALIRSTRGGKYNFPPYVFSLVKFRGTCLVQSGGFNFSSGFRICFNGK